ncbi:hypothetical protein O7632_20155 [Solwaraspora sp. WMMD406]|uniref:hypothetical protein n=1 Tax=Solwaraspora sp. WMMD406 TaxID=3016095 RepID=UPI002416AC40|nr:hypothetical protein [Solwaraspora sp. WMMD406]MDG4766397.1 hypothetical protein [Solwaraspora sp. WMMD406]
MFGSLPLPTGSLPRPVGPVGTLPVALPALASLAISVRRSPVVEAAIRCMAVLASILGPASIVEPAAVRRTGADPAALAETTTVGPALGCATVGCAAPVDGTPTICWTGPDPSVARRSIGETPIAAARRR